MSYFSSEFAITPPFSNSPAPSCIDMTSPNPLECDWPDMVASQDFDFVGHRQGPSCSESEHGLGLAGLQVAPSQAYLSMGFENGRSSNTLPCSWTNGFNLTRASLSYSQPVRLRQTHVDGSCNPMSTLMPGAIWDASHSMSDGAGIYNPSPLPSQYSPESHPSSISTPYARSDSVVRSADSPSQIKIEHVATPTHALAGGFVQDDFLEQTTSDEHSDFMSDSSGQIEQRIRGMLPSSSSDFKFPRARPVRGRAFSSEDVTADRKKRGYTKPNDAKCFCDQCGKPFQRSYNLRAHMDTHDPHRDQPHICSIQSCNKRFVRRTDLLRHQQSVHYKERNHVCTMCGNSFARKDTLRRHVEDGCPRRLEVKKRASRIRRASSASNMRTSPRQYKRECSPQHQYALNEIPSFS